MSGWLLASGNAHKLSEIGAILADFDVALVTPRDLSVDLDVDEWGETFAANAVIKATAWAAVSGRVTLADDSGLEVDGLGGDPGVHSARYAGDDATDADNNARLVARLAEAPELDRTARYRCVIAVAWPAAMAPVGTRRVASPAAVGPSDAAVVGNRWFVRTWCGAMEGRVDVVARGLGGFGYDPYFVLADGRHLAEVGSDEKNAISHRAAALAAMVPALRSAPELVAAT
jgi:XTP/dITP diphosphohydrolase